MPLPYQLVGLSMFAQAYPTTTTPTQDYIPEYLADASFYPVFVRLDGNNLNTGNIATSPVRTIERAVEQANAAPAGRAPVILVRFGESYELANTIALTKDGFTKQVVENNVTVTKTYHVRLAAWGDLSLAKPKIDGSTLVSTLGWTSLGGNKHKLSYATPVHGLYRNDVEMKAPYSPYYNITGNTNVSTEPLNDNASSSHYPTISLQMADKPADYYVGAYVLFFPVQWSYDIRRIKACTSNAGVTTFTLDRVSASYKSNASPSSSPTTGGNLYKYGLQYSPGAGEGRKAAIIGHQDFLDSDGEGFYNELTQELYVYTTSAPNTYNIRAIVKDYAYSCLTNSGNTAGNFRNYHWIENIEFLRFGHAAIYVRGKVENFTASSCTFKDIVKYGLDAQNINATTKVNISVHSNNVLVTRNHFENIGIAGGLHRDNANLTYSYNTGKRIGTSEKGIKRGELYNFSPQYMGYLCISEAFMVNVINGNTNANGLVKNQKVLYNSVEKLHSLCLMQGDGIQVTGNTVLEPCYSATDGAGLYTIDRFSNRAFNIEWSYNYVDDFGRDYIPNQLVPIHSNFHNTHGAYADEHTHDLHAFGNVFAGYEAFKMNNGVKNLHAHHNTFIGRYYGIVMREDFLEANVKFEYNTVILSTQHARFFSYKRPTNKQQSPNPIFPNNTIINYFGSELAISNTSNLSERSFNTVWSLEDLNAGTIAPGTVIATRQKNLGASYPFSVVQNRYTNGVEGVSNTVVNSGIVLSTNAAHSLVSDGANGIRLTVGANTTDAVVRIKAGENFKARTLYQLELTATPTANTRMNANKVMPFVNGSLNNGSEQEMFRLQAGEPNPRVISFYREADTDDNSDEVSLSFRSLSSAYSVHLKNIKLDKGGVFTTIQSLPQYQFKNYFSVKRGPLSINNIPIREGATADYGNISLLQDRLALEVTTANRRDLFVGSADDVVSLDSSDVYFIHATEEAELSRRLANNSTIANYYSTSQEDTNSSGDGSRSYGWAEDYVDNWASYVWNGPPVLDGNGAVRLYNASSTWPSNENEPTGNYSCRKMFACAYWSKYGTHLGATTREQYGQAVRSGILALIAKPRLDFRNTTLYPFNHFKDGNPGFLMDAMVQTVHDSFVLTKGSGIYSLSEKQAIDSWVFMAKQLFVIEHANTQFDTLFGSYANRLARNYSSIIAGQEGSKSEPTHWINNNGVPMPVNPIPTLAYHYNNRRGTYYWNAECFYSAMLKENNIDPNLCYRAAGATPTNSTKYTASYISSTLQKLSDSAKLFVEEVIKFSSFPDGTLAEFERSGDSSGAAAESGLYYTGGLLGMLCAIADMQARRGDHSLYNLSTREGKYGTEVPGALTPKSLYRCVDNYLMYVDKTHVPTRYATDEAAKLNSTYVIDGLEGAGPRQYTLESMCYMVGMYYHLKGDSAKANRIFNSVLRLNASNYDWPTPSNVGTSGEFRGETGFWGRWVMGLAHRYFKLNQVTGVNPY